MADEPFGADVPHDHAHAVGVFALYYNRLELTVYGLFDRYAPGSAATKTFLYASLHNQGRREFIRSASRERDIAEDAADVSYALKCFDICTENRNLLLHATFMWDDSETITMAKVKKEEPQFMNIYEFTAAHIRTAAISVDQTEAYVHGLVRYCEKAPTNAFLIDHRERPTRPPQPSKLSLFRPLATPKGEQPPPQS